MNEKLKPCPFCGGKAALFETTPPCRKLFWIECRKCGAEIHGEKIKEEAIAAWNKRKEK